MPMKRSLRFSFIVALAILLPLMAVACSRQKTSDSPQETSEAEPAYQRGNSYAFKDKHDKAIAEFTEAIRLEPRFAQAFYKRGNSYADKKEYDKAIADYAQAIRLDPKNAYAN